jgi:hypothetical protein
MKPTNQAPARAIVRLAGTLPPLKPKHHERITQADIDAAAAARFGNSRVAGQRLHVNAAMHEPLPAGGWQSVREGADDYLSIPSLGACVRP